VALEKNPEGADADAGERGRALGIFLERHWITLRTETDDRFIVLRVSGDTVGRVLSALEARTGRVRQFVAERRRKDVL
jgi:hypothetical protein